MKWYGKQVVMANLVEWIATAVGAIIVYTCIRGLRTPANFVGTLLGVTMVVLGVGFYVHWKLHWLLGTH